MEKKYYDLIISLIKEHRKFQGYEPIIDEIAKDVYEHSRVVLGSVINDDVIKSYINKVIAVSIITVSKKLGYRNKERRTFVPNIERATAFAETSYSTIEEPVIEKVVETKIEIENEVLDSVTNVKIEQTEPQKEDDVVETITIEQEPISNLELTFEKEEINSEELNIKTETIEKQDTATVVEDIETSEDLITLDSQPNEYSQTLSFVESDESSNEIIEETTTIDLPEKKTIQADETFETLSYEDTFIEMENAPLLQAEPLETIEPSSDVNITFVDNMINGVPTNDEDNVQEEIKEEISESIDEVDELEEIPSENKIQEYSLEEEEEEEEEEEAFEILDSIEPVIQEDDKTEEFTDDLASDLILPEETNFEELSTDSNIEQEENTIPSIEIESAEENIFNLEEENDDADESLILDNNDDLSLDSNITIQVSDDLIETQEEQELLTQEDNTDYFKAPSYDCINIDNYDEEIDSDEICKELLELENKNPGKNILRICKLKYTERKSIKEIAEELSITNNEVLETLDQIISTVKE